jgi:hypothetical protein
MTTKVDSVDILAERYDREERRRRSFPALFWFRVINQYPVRWPRC